MTALPSDHGVVTHFLSQYFVKFIKKDFSKEVKERKAL